MENLRRTSTTHSGEFSGLLWGIPIPLFPALLIALVAAVGISFTLADKSEWPLGLAMMPGLIIAGVTFWCLRYYGQKPRGTIADQVEFVFTRGDASPFNRSKR